MRDFIFLRNQLFRDKEVVSDVWLQSGKPGISQEANEMLYKFPETEDELFEYDCIVAFDPDWEQLDELQVKLLERWVAEKAGGLIVVAGPVFTPQWSSRRRGDPRIDTLKALYPVAFYYQGSATLSLGRFGSDKSWPLQFTRDGQEAEFLWLDENAAGQREGLGPVRGRLRLLRREGLQSRAPGSMPASAIPTRRSTTCSRSTWPASSTAPAACSSWPAARCGGCGPWMTSISSSSIPS